MNVRTGRIARHRYSGRRLGQELRHWQQYGPCLRGVNVSFERGKFHRHHGPVRLRQIHAYAHTLAGPDSATSGHILFSAGRPDSA